MEYQTTTLTRTPEPGQLGGLTDEWTERQEGNKTVRGTGELKAFY